MGFSAPNGQFAVFNKHPNFHFAVPPLHEHRQTLLYIHRTIHLAPLTIVEDVGDRASSDDILHMTFRGTKRVVKTYHGDRIVFYRQYSASTPLRVHISTRQSFHCSGKEHLG